MAILELSPKQKLIAIIAISFCFFVAEISVAFYTSSLALLADAFHYMNDLIGFIVALVAIIVSERAKSPQSFSFGWARAQLLGAFFNGVFLIALGISIFLQSIERFIKLQRVQNPKLVLIMGSVGLTLNIISATLLHEHHGHGHSHGHGHDHKHSHSSSPSGGAKHSHGHGHGPANLEAAIPASDSPRPTDVDTPSSAASTTTHAEHRHTVGASKLQPPGRDLGIAGVFLHAVGDALNNLGVVVAALVIWLTRHPARFYADPGVSVGIALMILLSSLPLVRSSGRILMQSAPGGVDLADVKHDLEKIPGIESVHELHIWRLDQRKSIASAHVVVSSNDMCEFMDQARTIAECLHAYGVHSATVQPELAGATPSPPVLLPSSSVSSFHCGALESTPVAVSAAAIAPAPAPAPTAEAPSAAAAAVASGASLRRRRPDGGVRCQVACGNLCDNLTCCNAGSMWI
ncbi:cation efflux protein [Xylariaceae sp. FL0804]|nr:cation efflux protein [Xylariaceae sp. FL0804]